MRETIETANQSNITYRQFKKMEHSGELQKVIQEAKIMQASPVSVGIEKFTQNNISTQQYQVKSPQFGLLQVKNNDGRNS